MTLASIQAAATAIASVVQPCLGPNGTAIILNKNKNIDRFVRWLAINIAATCTKNLCCNRTIYFNPRAVCVAGSY